jgi:hypothetical protein
MDRPLGGIEVSPRNKDEADDTPDFVDDSLDVQAAFITEFGEVDVSSPEDILGRMGKRYDKAENLDDLFDALGGQSSDALVGKKYRHHNVKWQPYQTEKGVIPLAVCEVTDLDTGEETEYVTSAYMLVRFLRRAKQLDAFPFDARITGKRTNRGQTALNYERV